MPASAKSNVEQLSGVERQSSTRGVESDLPPLGASLTSLVEPIIGTKRRRRAPAYRAETSVAFELSALRDACPRRRFP